MIITSEKLVAIFIIQSYQQIKRKEKYNRRNHIFYKTNIKPLITI